MAGTTMALALATAGATGAVAADESRITFVNGTAGKAIDICLNGREAKSGLKYGKVTSRVRDNGTYTLQFFKKNPRKCKGQKLAQRTIELGFNDLTVVATKRFPRIVVFDDTDLITAPANGTLAWRNASDLGPVAIKFVEPTPVAPTPAADPVWGKGEQAVAGTVPGVTYGILATRPDRTRVLAGPRFGTTQPGRRSEWILVGDRGRNARIVVFDRPFWDVPT